MQRLFILWVSLCMLSGCAGVTVTKITDSTYKEGVRFYRPWPYLWVTKEATRESTAEKVNDKTKNTTTETSKNVTTDKYSSKIIWLPKYDEEYVVKTTGLIGSAKYNIALADGWQLTSMGMERDTQIPQTITAVTGALTGVAGLFVTGRKIKNPPGLYPLKIDKISGLITGVDWDHPVFIEETN
jgi:nitrogen fixation protein